MSSIHRILDANANRAREALRVMEEAARFILDDAALMAAIKSIRHDLRESLAWSGSLILHRDTPGDVGTTVKASGEMTRGSVVDVVTAAGKRLSEALRAIEEYAKVLGPAGASASAAIERLRYRGYEVERRLAFALGCGRRRQWRVCVLITEALCRSGDWLGVARASIQAGADCLQLREKAMEGGLLLERAKRLADLCHEADAALIINDRPDIAMLADADGVHLGQTDLPCAAARRLVGDHLLIGVSTSCLAEAEQAAADGADYCGVGPMFPTSTKHKDVIVGPPYLQAYTTWNRLPHLAIGGITPANVAELVAAGCRGVAVSSVVCAAPDPADVVRELVAAMTADQSA